MELKTSTSYDNIDSELVYMVKENSEDAKDELYKKYSALIHKEINRFKAKAIVLYSGESFENWSFEGIL